MIHDKLDNAAFYEGLSPRFAAAFRWLAATDLGTLGEGRVEIEGGEVFATLYRYDTAPAGARPYETHRKFADLQLMLEGREIMLYRQAEGLEGEEDYDEAKDCAFWKSAPGLPLLVERGEFAVFFPQDAHLPKVAAGAGERVAKLVIKIAV